MRSSHDLRRADPDPGCHHLRPQSRISPQTGTRTGFCPRRAAPEQPRAAAARDMNGPTEWRGDSACYAGMVLVENERHRICASLATLQARIANGLPHDAIRQVLAHLIGMMDQCYRLKEALLHKQSSPDTPACRIEHHRTMEHALRLLNAPPADPAQTAQAIAYLADWAERESCE
ncbi:MAG: hypothetical protein M0037_14470 [Betaproteobacteria bacterium]|nr:hypothetical protein [Betaproteobacteria bacterium]